MATSAQFSIRSMLAMTFVVACLLAILAPVVRHWSRPTLLVFLGQALVMYLVCIGVVAAQFAARWRLERAAGKRLLLAATHPGWLARTWRWMGLFAAFAFLALIFWENALTVTEHGISDVCGAYLLQGVFLIVLLPHYVAVFWWGVGTYSVELCEHGMILHGYILKPWDVVRRFHWSQFFPNTLVVVEQFDTWELRIPEEQRAAAESIFRERAGTG